MVLGQEPLVVVVVAVFKNFSWINGDGETNGDGDGDGDGDGVEMEMAMAMEMEMGSAAITDPSLPSWTMPSITC